MSVIWIDSGRFAAAATDPNFANVSLLLHGDGANASTSIIDSSSSPKTITRTGDPRISTAQSKFGGASILLNGTSQYLTCSANAAFGFGAGDFTIEFWLYYTGGNGYACFCTNLLNEVQDTYIYYGLDQGDKKQWIWSNRSVLTGTANIVNNQWQHHAVVRSAGQLLLFLDGTLAGSTTWTASIGTSNPFFIGSPGSANQLTAGYVDDLRVTKGIARYTAAFTPPTAPFPDA